MFANTVQSSLLSLFSSTGSDPLQLFSQHIDKDLPEDSFIHLLNDTTNEPAPLGPRKLIHSVLITEDGDQSVRKKTLCQTVLHIQSPTIRSTYIRCPAGLGDLKRNVLRLNHPWINLQVRNMCHEWAFEVGVVDNMGTPGTSRTSVDSERFSPSSPNGVHNGINGKHLSEASLNTSDPLAGLEALRKEKEELAKQYADQTARFNNVKTTLGTKLRQFAVCRVISNAWF